MFFFPGAGDRVHPELPILGKFSAPELCPQLSYGFLVLLSQDCWEHGTGKPGAAEREVISCVICNKKYVPFLQAGSHTTTEPQMHQSIYGPQGENWEAFLTIP